MSSRFRNYPKALLHDHLDGGLRVDTILELADAAGYDGLPFSDPTELAAWFHQGESGSLDAYLQAFTHTVAVMQSAAALERVAYESVMDLAADGVRYAELRFAPSLHTAGGLEPTEVVAAVAGGIRSGEKESGCITRIIVTAMRDANDSEDVAKLAIASRDLGVVGFDVAGPEAGFPNANYRSACRQADEANVPITIHAGEGDGVGQISQAIHHCRARRIGHGVRIIEDTTVENGDVTDLGELAGYVRDLHVTLEVSVLSNLHTGIYPDAAAHPVGALHRAGFAVTLNTDNRLMSGTSMSREFALAADHHGFGPEDFHRVTRAALDAGFAEWPVRQLLLADVNDQYRSEFGSSL
ncbi:MAG: adenosine deaminase [Acidimicrobiia bacterium]|nr:adenosine deaminase [Acidimicrobiia bacterium]